MIGGGIDLDVRIGPAYARQLPLEVLEAIAVVHVRSASKGRSGFQVTFRLDKGGTLETEWLPGWELEPLVTRVRIDVDVRGERHRLMDGVLTQQQVDTSNEPGRATLTLTGEDIAVLMDVVDLTGVPYPWMPSYARIMTVLGRYGPLGVLPGVVPDPRFFMDASHGGVHKGTDYAYVSQLADDLGYVFYMDFDRLDGQSLAYVGPEIGWGRATQPALTANMGPHSNVESLGFTFDGLAKQVDVVWMQEPTSKVTFPIPIPDLSATMRPVLGRKVQTAQRVKQTNGRVDPLRYTELLKQFGGKLLSSTDSVRGEGSLDVVRYGHVLKARAMVGVRGAGPAYDGSYFVESVDHELRPGGHYKQNFALKREGLDAPTSHEEVMV